MRPIRTYEEYRRRFFPQEVEHERIANLTPEEFGEELARKMLKRVARAMRKVKQ